MGKRGPHKEPAAIKIAKGTYNPAKDKPAVVYDGSPEPPAWLTGKSLEMWDEVLRQLDTVPDLVAAVDSTSLARYCQDLVEYIALQEWIADNGRIAVSRAGALYQHPNVSMRNKTADRLFRFETRFGMTPSDRTGLGVPKKPAQGVRTRKHG